jgi:UDP-galactopyranose mutase
VASYDWLIVGAGFSGAVLAERIATQRDQRVLVVDRRPHIGGNAHDYLDEAGVLIHRYGPHLFHTNSQRVWEYLSRFTSWRPYEHRVQASVEGNHVPVPFNLTSLQMLFPADRAAALTQALLARYGQDAHVPILKMRQQEDPQLRDLGEYIYHAIFHGYTTKQWGLPPQALSASVTGRVPVRVSHDDRYFLDKYQAMPADGYTRLFQRMLSHRNITVVLGVDWRDLGSAIRYKRMAYTGPIDAYFNYAHGPLPYRSLRFEFETLEQERALEVGQINYPNDHRHTRVVEIKHATGQECPNTTLCREYPQPHVAGATEPFYPIPREENRAIFQCYQDEAAKLGGSVVFCGRLADYQYYNMDQVVARSLMVFEQEVAGDATHLRGTGDAQPQVAAA